jgi:hypothetical protein
MFLVPCNVDIGYFKKNWEARDLPRAESEAGDKHRQAYCRTLTETKPN